MGKLYIEEMLQFTVDRGASVSRHYAAQLSLPPLESTYCTEGLEGGLQYGCSPVKYASRTTREQNSIAAVNLAVFHHESVGQNRAR